MTAFRVPFVKAQESDMAYTWNSPKEAGERYFIIGNGFDLECGLHTKYTDFLDEVKLFEDARTELAYRISESRKDKDNVGFEQIEIASGIDEDWYTHSAPHTKAFIDMFENFWYKYFKVYVNSNKFYDPETETFKDKWVDFEQAVKEVIIAIKDVGHQSSVLPDIPVDTTDKVLKNKLYDAFLKLNTLYGSSFTYEQLYYYLYTELHLLAKALGNYFLYSCVNKPLGNSPYIRLLINDICASSNPRIINFNYTNTLERKFQEMRCDINYLEDNSCHIHGKLVDEQSLNSLILGIGGIGDTFNGLAHYRNSIMPFVKSYQRDNSGTESMLATWRQNRIEENNRELIIYGHSLSENDGDIIKEIFDLPNLRIKIYTKADKGDLLKSLSYLNASQIKLLRNSSNIKGDDTIFKIIDVRKQV